jgi:hypothetical protein
MRRFVTHALLFALLQVAILVALWRACPDDPDHYMAATLDKHARLRAAESPRVIFVGGSSMGFSIDSRPFAALGLAPVNMGLNDGLGLAFMLAEVESELRPGDVVVIAPETHLYWTGSQDDAVWAVLQRRPASLRCLAAAGPRALADASDQGLHFLARKVRCAAHQVSTDRALPTIYRRSSFDALGDFVGHRGQPAKREQAIDPPWPAPQALHLERALADLRGFADTCRVVGARCFVAWCPLRSEQLAREGEVLALLETRLRDEVGLPLLEHPDEAGYPEEAFFDRGPHLGGEAAAARSARLAARLETALARPQRPAR